MTCFISCWNNSRQACCRGTKEEKNCFSDTFQKWAHREAAIFCFLATGSSFTSQESLISTEDTTQHHPTWGPAWSRSNAFRGTHIFFYLLLEEVVAFCNREITPRQVMQFSAIPSQKERWNSTIACILDRLIAFYRSCWSISWLFAVFAHTEAWEEIQRGI